jgi:hypothetical protein
MKNEYDSEEGQCGLWIAQIKNGEVQTQEHIWTELCMEEMQYIGMNH